MSYGVDVRVVGRDGVPIPRTHRHFEEVVARTQHVNLVRPTSAVDLDYARKLFEGQRAFFFFGFNDDVDQAYEDIWPVGGDINWQTAATIVEVLSTNAADESTSGIGTRSVEIHGLDAVGNDQDEVILMNGVNAVQSVKSYIRINKMHNETVGTYGGSHEGDITCQVTGGGAVLSKMVGREGSINVSPQYGTGEAGNGFWSVPKGKVLYITDLRVAVTVKGNATVDIILYEREGITNVDAPYDPRRILWSAFAIDAPVEKRFKSHIKIKQLTDIWFRAKGSGTNNKISVSLDFYLLDRNASGA